MDQLTRLANIPALLHGIKEVVRPEAALVLIFPAGAFLLIEVEFH